MKKKILVVCVFIIVIVTVCIFTILNIQQDLFFYPWHDKESYNILINNNEFNEIIINNNEKLLHGWIKKDIQNEVAPLLIFFGGNAQNSSNTCMTFVRNNVFEYFEGYHFLIVDYPGYGLSEGNPSDVTMFEAALNIYDYVTKLEYVDNSNIVIVGYSIGTGVATYLSSEREVRGLILVSPYDKALSLYNETLNIFYGPMENLAKYKFDSISYAKDIDVNPLIITSYDDEVINYKLTLKLAKNFKEIYQTIILEGVKHNEYFLEEEVLNSIKNYLLDKL